MKQGRRKKSAAAPALKADVAASAGGEPPDAAYVEQLLLASAGSHAEVDAGPALVDGILALPAQCLLRDASDCRRRLLDCLHAEAVAIDVAAVERVDTAFMQVLLAFVRSRAGNGGPVAWRNVNAVFAEAVTVLGLRAALRIPDVSAAEQIG